jgi:hypothetical protein
VRIGEGETRGEAIEPADRLRIAAADPLFGEPFVGEPGLDLRRPAIQDVEVEKIG